MFLVTMMHLQFGDRMRRKAFASLRELEDYMDYHENLNWITMEVAICDLFEIPT